MDTCTLLYNRFILCSWPLINNVWYNQECEWLSKRTGVLMEFPLTCRTEMLSSYADLWVVFYKSANLLNKVKVPVDKIKRNMFILNYADDSLMMQHTESFIKSLDLSWVKRFWDYFSSQIILQRIFTVSHWTLKHVNANWHNYTNFRYTWRKNISNSFSHLPNIVLPFHNVKSTVYNLYLLIDD